MLTLEGFLTYQCGMAPPKLVEYYEDHREFIELYLSKHYDPNFSQEEWEDVMEDLCLLIPEPPEWFRSE